MNFSSSFWGPIFHTNVKEERREDHFPIQLLGGEADEEESTQPFPPYNSFPVLKCAMKAYISRIGGYLLVEKSVKVTTRFHVALFPFLLPPPSVWMIMGFKSSNYSDEEGKQRTLLTMALV
jgi:hypothetical protein